VTRSNRAHGPRSCSPSRLLSILSGMGIEIRVRDQELDYRFMDPLKVFDRDPLTDERRIASNRRSEAFHAMVARKRELIEHWNRSPGDEIFGYPDQLRICPHEFQQIVIDEHRKRDLLVRITPDSQDEQWWEDPALQGLASSPLYSGSREQSELENSAP